MVLTDRAIRVLEFKSRAADAAGLRQVEDYALDLRDFHEGSRSHPIVPILVAGEVVPRPVQRSLPWPDVAEPLSATSDGLSLLIREILTAIPEPDVPLDGQAWLRASHLPVPTIIETATAPYARHGVAQIARR